MICHRLLQGLRRDRSRDDLPAVNMQHRLGRVAGPRAVEPAEEHRRQSVHASIPTTPDESRASGLVRELSSRVRAALRDPEWEAPTIEPPRIDVAARLADWERERPR